MQSYIVCSNDLLHNRLMSSVFLPNYGKAICANMFDKLQFPLKNMLYGTGIYSCLTLCGTFNAYRCYNNKISIIYLSGLLSVSVLKMFASNQELRLVYYCRRQLVLFFSQNCNSYAYLTWF